MVLLSDNNFSKSEPPMINLVDNNFSIEIPTLQLHHLKELTEKRDLPVSWIEVNCVSLDKEEASRRLGFTAPSEGIWIQGEGKQGQFKPDIPFKDKNGKLCKYITPKGSDFDAVKPKLPEGGIWNPIKVKGHRCLLITEGIFKAIYASAMGYPTIALMGVEMGLTPSEHDPEGRRYLVPLLRKFAEQNYGFIFAFDADIVRKKGVQLALKKLADALKAFDVPLYQLPVWDEKEGKGIDDYIQNQGIGAFLKLVESVEEVKIEKKKYRKLSPGKLWDFLCDNFAGRVYFNALEQRVYLDGEPVNCSQIGVRLLTEYHIECADKKAEDLLIHLAKENTIDPVKNYLESVNACTKPISIDNLATRYFGVNHPLYDKMLKWTLIGAVARVYQPGCKFDNALVLQGKGGLGKSTFFKILAGDWLDASMESVGDKDELLKLHSCWIEEWAEIERITNKAELGRVKSFITRLADTFRVPYGRETVSHPRRSIIVGTVNPDQFLADGDRRFWVIPVQYVDTNTLVKERDALWAAAVRAYKNGESFSPNREEEAEILAMGETFRVSDEWEPMIADYLEDRPHCWVGKILEKVLGIETARFDKHIQMRVAGVLQKIGWQKVGLKRVTDDDGSQKRVVLWERKAPKPSNFVNTCNTSEGVLTEVLTAEIPTTQELSTPHVLSTPKTEKEKNTLSFDTFPHRSSDNSRAKENRATQIKDQMLSCTTSGGLQKFKENAGFSETEIKWVWNNLLSEWEKEKVKEASSAQQLELFSQESIGYHDVIAEIDQLMKQLGWTVTEGKQYLFETYNKPSRVLLSDAELLDFLCTLRNLVQ